VNAAAGGPAGVLARVERELRALWTTAPAPGQVPKTRACTTNLVVVVASPALERWVPIVDDVILEVPARALVVGLDPDGKDDIDASVSAVCAPGEGTIVCSERVTLRMGGALCARVASCVEALCASDVPTTLVWPGHVRVDDPAFAPIARSAYRVVLESHGSLASLANVVRWARAQPGGERPGVAELAWTRLAPWQELCARMFDDVRVRGLSATVTRVRIAQALGGAASLGPEGALMLGWLGTDGRRRRSRASCAWSGPTPRRSKSSFKRIAPRRRPEARWLRSRSRRAAAGPSFAERSRAPAASTRRARGGST
jgi:hypothetical protein